MQIYLGHHHLLLIITYCLLPHMRIFPLVVNPKISCNINCSMYHQMIHLIQIYHRPHLSHPNQPNHFHNSLNHWTCSTCRSCKGIWFKGPVAPTFPSAPSFDVGSFITLLHQFTSSFVEPSRTNQICSSTWPTIPR